ncbi:hypothetical protein X943_003189 [Babesia divergens]|uniref:Ribosome quality control complex subunit 2 n=1 Tax=Babesia divergens TaxID=32595 RepID=A0AAD9LHE2_BABDI|nr:hypothetical protein X943_003189 [Babesia divergens]
MARERLNAVDVAAVVCNLRKLILDYNLVNIYDITNRIFVLKFSRKEDKKFVLFEIGHRIHTTQFLRSTDHLPSNFNVKLRKHLRTRKLRGIEQIAQDRVVDFTFSSGEYAYHLIVQFFLPGNVYLTDYTYKVLAVLRPHNAGEAFFKVGQIYEIPETHIPWNVPVAPKILDEALQRMQVVPGPSTVTSALPTSLKGGAKKSGNSTKDKRNDPVKEDAEENGGHDDSSVHALLKTIFPSVHTNLADHVIKETVGDATIGSHNIADLDKSLLLELVESVRKAVASVSHSETLVPGFLYKGGQEYDDFSPFDINDGAERFDDFNDALDAYFTNSEMKKIEKKEQPKKPIKLQKIKDDQNRREMKLEHEVERLNSAIELTEAHRSVFDSVLDLLRSLVASGASWREIMDQLALQRECGHPLAKHIRSVNIADRLVDVCLPSDDPSFYGSTAGSDVKSVKKRLKKDAANDPSDVSSATLDYGLTCFQNLEIMYKNKKKLAEKLERTRIGREFALKRVDDQKEKVKQKASGKSPSLVKVRKRMWFEKFHWFISSDGYLVLGGRDSTQNELLVKRYLTKGDLYFHADIHGASSCILKNPKQVAELPTQTIEEAACFAVCLSSAWNQKMVIPAWWVHHDQVSRSAPSGEYLPHGSFMIRGKKNYVQPQRLEMAIGILFHVDTPHTHDDMDDATHADDVSSVPPQPVEKWPGEGGDDTSPRSLDYAESIIIGEHIENDISDYSVANDSGSEDADQIDGSGSSDDSKTEDTANEDAKVPGNVRAVGFAVDEEDYMSKRVVRFDTSNISVHPVDVQDTSLRQTFGRKGTGYVCAGFEPAHLVEKLSQLGLIEEFPEEPPTDSVRFIEPEAVEHSPEAVQRLRQRIPTGLPGKTKKQGLSKFAAKKLARAKKKYGEDDEETQELRRKLTGSKPLKHIEESMAAPGGDKVEAPVNKPAFQREPIKPLDESELTSHMQQLRMLCKDPDEDAVIISAVPMCAPYNALKTHPYHLKLVPGGTKKGAIASQSLHHFLKVDPSKEQYVKLITVDQFSLALIENCKIPGGAAGPRRV